MNKYKIIAIMGKAGTGKDTLLKKLVSLPLRDFHPIISCTTRPIRENEKEGVDYYFLSNEEFAQRVMDGRMFEATVFNNWCYGMSKDALDIKKYNIGVFNPEGISILAENPSIDLMVLWCCCTPKLRLLRQLNREDNPDVDEIIRRYQTDEADFVDFDYGYNVINTNGSLDAEVVSALEYIDQWTKQINNPS